MISQSGTVLGIVGGVGPIASAEFLRTIYEFSAGRREQETPFVLLHSDPSYPDRTETLLNGNPQPLLDQLTRTLKSLRSFGASRIVICCVTIHDLLRYLPEEERSNVLSLVDIILWQAANSSQKYLLFCTNGTRKLRLFEKSPFWPIARDRLVLPGDKDQQTVHDLIYDLKQHSVARRHEEQIKRLLVKYSAGSFAAGCTEIHLVTKRLASQMSSEQGGGCIDPLVTVASALSNGNLEDLAWNLRLSPSLPRDGGRGTCDDASLPHQLEPVRADPRPLSVRRPMKDDQQANKAPIQNAERNSLP
jgi:aspartate racemase